MVRAVPTGHTPQERSWQITCSTVLAATAVLLEVTCMVTTFVGGNFLGFLVAWVAGFVIALGASCMPQNRAGVVLVVCAVLLAFIPVVIGIMAITHQN